MVEASRNIVELYEMPACSDPLAADVANPALREINRVVKELESEGVIVHRYWPSENITPFMRNPQVAALMYRQRLKALPITVVNGSVIKVESYPAIDELRAALAGKPPAAKEE